MEHYDFVPGSSYYVYSICVQGLFHVNKSPLPKACCRRSIKRVNDDPNCNIFLLVYCEFCRSVV